ncbi:MAG: HlyD family efflux transporter periplasmic adaptor subunit [Proteobacteria bacterium]|nr:HlyD family efflux transporter periplasmic adaptor subunit [Pseudomonadota bacterium]MBU1596678.1 HlyD family efflux transporter periplasmic adaptor subunit [Pseudomonadota bacterium]
MDLLQRIPFRARLILAGLAALVLGLLVVRTIFSPKTETFQGYVEAEFVHVAAPVAGALFELRVSRGQEVAAGAPLFVLEQDYERAALAVATHSLKQAADRLADTMKGQRPSELAAISARLGQAGTSLRLAETEFKRRQKLYEERTISAEEMDRARADYEFKVQQVREMSANLSTARLGARTDAVGAAQAEVEAAKARVEQAAWTLAQKSQAAPAAARVFDTLYSQGEWVPAGRAVAVLLPPANIKVRFYVPEEKVGGLSLGQEAVVRFDGAAKGAAGDVPVRLSFISPQAEYTPPILFSSGNRAKLVFLVEARPAPEAARTLHPGQPVDVRLALTAGK